MTNKFEGWEQVAKNILNTTGKCQDSDDEHRILNDGQIESLEVISSRILKHGIIIADEVGLGKTRIAAIVAKSVVQAGGRVAILVPPGLGFQWKEELTFVGTKVQPILRSKWQFFQRWENCESSSCDFWFDEQVVLLSHSFTNWRLGGNSSSWRWSLLPEIYAHWHKHIEVSGRFPYGYRNATQLNYDCVKICARKIVDKAFFEGKKSEYYSELKHIVSSSKWPGILNSYDYSNGQSDYRSNLEKAVGLGLGIFDLVIVDEAHKSRQDSSMLNKLLGNLVLQSSTARRLALTATPVELESEQWHHMLGRINVDSSHLDVTFRNYSSSVKEVRRCLSDQIVRRSYIDESRKFQKALENYVLRRDKRLDPSVLKYRDYSGEQLHTYRREVEVLIEPENLSYKWKKIICAAEALSYVSKNTDDSEAKRLRLTLGNGHGIAALIDKSYSMQKDDKGQIEYDLDLINLKESDFKNHLSTSNEKKRERIKWWREIIDKTLSAQSNDSEVLFEHPALLAAIEEIESVTDRGEKVLVFGRFTRPMRALVALLNARSMLKCLSGEQLWAQSKVPESDWYAVEVAFRQLYPSHTFNRDVIKEKLSVQYSKLERQRQRQREKMLLCIRNGLASGDFSKDVHELFDIFEKRVQKAVLDDNFDQDLSFTWVTRAMQEHLFFAGQDPSEFEYAKCFSELVEASIDKDDSDQDVEDKIEEVTLERWELFTEQLKEEYSGEQGRFARLMYGETKPKSRRYLQMAFNRINSFTKVLVAQSMVGREGLNLHKACRTVVLLHPEWNPGVVEQQIGRVDRIGSYWESILNAAVEAGQKGTQLPRIEVRAIIFQGTYDEKNWQVLRERWNDLRAQLHGVVITNSISKKYKNGTDWMVEINNGAPDFYPVKKYT